MTFLGDFGEEREPLDLTFGWCGEMFRVHPDATDLGFMEFMAQAQGVEMPEDADSLDPAKAAALANRMTQATTMMHRFIRDQIHPEDWDRFWTVAKAHRQQTSDLMRLSHNLTAAIAGFPTGQSSGSASPPQSVSKKSSGGSSTAGRAARRAQSRREPTRREQVVGRALDMLPGRADLRLALMEQEFERQQYEQARSA